MKPLSVFMLISLFSFISQAHAGLERGEAAPHAPNCSPDTFALVIGETTSFNSLGHPSAAKDARDMAAFLNDRAANVTLLIDKSKDEAVAALKLFAAKQPGAVHILYLSGTADEKNGTHFVWFHLDQEPTGPDSDNDSLRDAHAISVDDIRDLFSAAHVPLILIADDCLGSIDNLRSNELVALAGRAAFENSNGGYFTQALLKQLQDDQKEPRLSKLSSALFSAALTVFDKSGKQQAPVVIWHASSPDLDVSAGKLVPICDGPSEAKPRAQ